MDLQTTTTSLADRVIGELAARMPGATRVFRKHRLDYCCNGDRTLRQAAEQRGIDLHILQDELASADVSEEVDEALSTETLIEHILERYHAMHRKEVPALIRLAHKVERVHREHPEAPRGLAATLEAGFAHLDTHMHQEEASLFPHIKQTSNAVPESLLDQLRQDHDSHGEFLAELESLTNSFTPPEGACRTWKALYAGTARFFNDVMHHVHVENNILFRRLAA